MAKRKKRQPRCKSIREHISTLFIYNPESAIHYGQRGWSFYTRIGL